MCWCDEVDQRNGQGQAGAINTRRHSFQTGGYGGTHARSWPLDGYGTEGKVERKTWCRFLGTVSLARVEYIQEDGLERTGREDGVQRREGRLDTARGGRSQTR